MGARLLSLQGSYKCASMPQDNKDKNISKSLSYWLRHAPDVGQLTLDPSGWADVPDVLAALQSQRLPHQFEDLERVVSDSDKQRFELSADHSQIRARQGHSFPVDLDWPIMTPPATLYHGTVERFLEAIMADGLRPMQRHHVHLSPDRDTATIVGQRRGAPVILTIDAARMAADGHVFRLSSNNVWLADHVPAAYLHRD